MWRCVTAIVKIILATSVLASKMQPRAQMQTMALAAPKIWALLKVKASTHFSA